MKKPLKIFAVLALSGASLAVPMRAYCDAPADEWKAPPRAARKKNPNACDDKSIAAGKLVYDKQCLSCHGPQGHGDGTAAKDLNPKPHDLADAAIQSQSDGALFWKITEGRKPMPTFDKLITDDERWNVVNFVRTLAAKGGKQ